MSPRTTLVVAAVCVSLASSACSSRPLVDARQEPPGDSPSVAATIGIFDHIPQFGIYETEAPSYTPPDNVLMWNNGTAFAALLTPEQKAGLGADLAARITYHAQCDDYDRLGSVFFVSMPPGETPTEDTPRIEIARFITPFSDYRRGPLATRVFPDADISPFVGALRDATRDVWIGIGGGSNPYDGDPCTEASVTPEFRAIGFKYSLDLISTLPASNAATAFTLAAASSVAETELPIVAQFTNPGESVVGSLMVIVSGHGSDSGGNEYRSTEQQVTLAGSEVGSFETGVDCAPYAQFSPDGNPGIFRGNLGANPRNWCPGALVPVWRFPATLPAGTSDVTLEITPSDAPAGSSYVTTLLFTAD